jgi:IclR family acetate operon transcriptional repressor
MAPDSPVEPRARGGVQSLERAFAILEAIADAGGVCGLSQLAAYADLPPTTIHRLVRTLVDLGYLRQEPSRQYSLGPGLMRLVDATTKRIATLAYPHMSSVVQELGESANLAVLEGDDIIYVAYVQPSQNLMQVVTEVGRRVHPHATALGKAILASRPEAEVRELLKRTGMPRYTANTLTTPEMMLADLVSVRERGYALEEGEQEMGVRCVAVTVPDAPRPLALSVSGPATRMTDEMITRAAPVLARATQDIGNELGAG